MVERRGLEPLTPALHTERRVSVGSRRRLSLQVTGVGRLGRSGGVNPVGYRTGYIAGGGGINWSAGTSS